MLVGTIGAASLFLAGNAGVSADTTHKVANHDTVWGLSQKYGVSIQSIEQLNHISSNSHLIYPGQNVQIPDKDAKATPVKATTPKQTANTSTYSVKAGDSLWTIAQAHKTSVAKLMSLNNLNSSVLQPGQTLKVVGTVAAQPAKTQAQPQQQPQATQPEEKAEQQQPTQPAKTEAVQTKAQPKVSANHVTHEVKSGESLYTLANDYGVTVDSLREANALSSSALQVGQSLTINDPTKDPSAVQSAPTAAPVKTSVQQTAKAQSSTPAPQKTEQQSNSTANNNVVSKPQQTVSNSSNTVQSTPVASSNQQHGQAANSAGNTYAWGQCTWFAKNRASWAGNYWGNGGNWDSSARSQGFAVNNTPAAGSLVVFHPGQSVGGQWTADGYAGHVAYVESVSGNTITISQGGMGFSSPSGPNYQTISNASQYTYIHPYE
ncbi:Surface antigen [Ligilactobacillus acidipiscis]|uniref:Surface antigen n=1 Tax=Ligilactobacillus acidipiscis TaxID=89059 RepID=A0A0R2JMD5_9LACO|nr:Surface antigen [Ligilactobacillus acidipiscis]